MEKVPRELFVPKKYSGYSYSDRPLPIPGNQTISAPSIHAIILSELNLKENDRVLEIGSGSGILLAYIKEIVGSKGKVVGIEINEKTYKFARGNLRKLNYRNITLIHGDGSSGYPRYAPYDKIVVSAASPYIPEPLLKQLKHGGVMIIVVGIPTAGQELIKVRKTKSGKLIEKELLPVIFVPLTGEHGWK